MYYRNYTGMQDVSFVERFIILCTYLGDSTIGGSTVVANLATSPVLLFSPVNKNLAG